MQTTMRTTLLVLALVPWGTESALAQAYPPPASGPPSTSSPPLASNPPSQSGQYSSNEVIDAGHRFFGTISRGLAEIVEKAGSQWGLPNGYVLGQEAGGAWVAGLRYGEGMLRKHQHQWAGSWAVHPVRSMVLVISSARSAVRG